MAATLTVGRGAAILQQQRAMGIAAPRAAPAHARMQSASMHRRTDTRNTHTDNNGRAVTAAVSAALLPPKHTRPFVSAHIPESIPVRVPSAACVPIAAAASASCVASSSVVPSVASASPSLSDVYGAEDVPLVLDHLSQWWSVLQMQEFMTWLHEQVGLPWWGSIAAATVVLRVVALPFEVAMLRNSLRIKQILPDVERMQAQMNDALTPDDKKRHAQALIKLFQDRRYEDTQATTDVGSAVLCVTAAACV